MRSGSMRTGRHEMLPLLMLAATMLASCGYQAGFPRRQKALRTVAIRVVGNDTFRQQLERPLTRELNRSLPLHTGYRIGGQRTADSVLEVTINTGENLRVVAGAPPVVEGALDITAKIRLVDRRSGEALVESKVRDLAEYRTTLAETEASARNELAQDLARRIVLALEGGF